MAVTWTPYADGVSLLTLRNAFNTFNTAVKNNIDSIEADIVTLGTDKVSIADGGLVYVSGGVLSPLSITTSYAKVGLINTTSVDNANGHITVNNTLFTYTINTTGVYKLVFSGVFTAPVNSELEFNYNVAGISMFTVAPVFIGAGAKGVHISNHTIQTLTAGTVIYIEARADSAISLTPSGCGLQIEKTHH